MGVCNALVTNETPQKLSDNFREIFDRIFSGCTVFGEGNVRKNEDACGEWSRKMPKTVPQNRRRS